MYLLFIIFSFFPINTEPEEEKKAEEINEAIISTDEKCLNLVMTKWFDMFTEAQEMGYNMNQADDVAIDFALEQMDNKCK